MTIGLTSKQAELLAWLTRHLAETGGVSPSFEEIAAALGLASKSGVSRLLDALEERGHIRRLRCRQRSIEILAAPAPVDVAGLDDDQLRGLGRRVAEEMARRVDAGRAA